MKTFSRSLRACRPLPQPIPAPHSRSLHLHLHLRPLLRPRQGISSNSSSSRSTTARSTLIAPPRPESGPLMQRRADRALPDVSSPNGRWLRTLPLFAAALGLSALAIFNYQKASSSVVSATLYALRTSPRARAVLGDEIYFRDRFPWVWGELNQLHGRIDIGFGVKGRSATGYMRFRSFRRSKAGFFQTVEWSLETEDGQVVQLLDEEDPFRKTILQAEPKA